MNYVEAAYGQHIMKIVFGVNENLKAKFDSWVLLSQYPENRALMKHLNFLSKPIFFKGRKMYFRVSVYSVAHGIQAGQLWRAL